MGLSCREGTRGRRTRDATRRKPAPPPTLSFSLPLTLSPLPSLPLSPAPHSLFHPPSSAAREDRSLDRSAGERRLLCKCWSRHFPPRVLSGGASCLLLLAARIHKRFPSPTSLPTTPPPSPTQPLHTGQRHTACSYKTDLRLFARIPLFSFGRLQPCTSSACAQLAVRSSSKSHSSCLRTVSVRYRKGTGNQRGRRAVAESQVLHALAPLHLPLPLPRPSPGPQVGPRLTPKSVFA